MSNLNVSSGFCRTCPAFCATCDKTKPAPAVLSPFNKSLVSSKAASQVCQEYSLQAVVKATNGWSEDNLLGTGAYGDVYRAFSPTDDATPWAVKRAKIVTTDFDTEVCEMATKHHPNLVQLLGFAIGITDKTRVEQILIYELMPNKDLSYWIGKGHTVCTVLIIEAELLLSFEQRVGVLVGRHAALRCVTRLMISSPLLSSPLLSSPWGVVVCSFGILMLELMTGRHVTTNSLVIPSEKEADQQLHLLEWVQQQPAQLGSNNGVVAWLKDARMEARDELVMRVVQLALRCTDKQSAMRPAMGVIAAELEDVLVALGGARSNSAARQVDQQVESQREPARDLDADFALLDALLADKVNGQHAAAS
ncbi:unnamed protein product [Closterium sp. NIES-53]